MSSFDLIMHKIYSCNNTEEIEQAYIDSLELTLNDEERQNVIKLCSHRKDAILGAVSLLIKVVPLYDKKFNKDKSEAKFDLISKF